MLEITFIKKKNNKVALCLTQQNSKRLVNYIINDKIKHKMSPNYHKLKTKYC